MEFVLLKGGIFYKEYRCEICVDFFYLDRKNILLFTSCSDGCLMSSRFFFLQICKAAYQNF